MNSLKLLKLKPKSQEHAMGCGLACVAFLTGKSYRHVLRQVDNPAYAWTRGFYCPELVALLAGFNLHYTWRKVKSSEIIESFPNGAILFIKPGVKYPNGHFVVKVAARRYMNPWSNFPSIRNAKASFQSRIDGVSYAVLPEACAN